MLRFVIALSLVAQLCLTSTAYAQSPQAETPAVQATPLPSPPPGAKLLPGGTSVVVSLLEEVSSATAHEDDQIGIVAKKEVRVNGDVLIAAGATGHATVTSVETAKSNGSGGKLAISIDWINAVDGGKVKLSPTNHASESGDSKGAASTATLLSWALLGPLGFFAHNFVRGRDVIIDKKKSFTVFTDHDVYIKDAIVTTPTDPYAPR